MTPTPEQIAEFRKDFFRLNKLPIDLEGSFATIGVLLSGLTGIPMIDGTHKHSFVKDETK
jgi:hypothetical protein